MVVWGYFINVEHFSATWWILKLGEGSGLAIVFAPGLGLA